MRYIADRHNAIIRFVGIFVRMQLDVVIDFSNGRDDDVMRTVRHHAVLFKNTFI